MTDFLGLTFQKLTLDHQSELESFLQQYPQRLSGYTFAMLFAWNGMFSYEWTRLDDETLLIAAFVPSDRQRSLLQPEGEFGVVSQQLLLHAIRELDYPLKLTGVTDSFLVQYPEFSMHFDVVEDRGQDNYVYAAIDLATLAGRRYSKKRNLIAQAESVYQWSAHPLAVGSREDCVRVLERIAYVEGETLSQSLRYERQALHAIMTHFSRLHQRGVLIRIDGEPVAFSIYEPLVPDTAVIHFEKAERQLKGLYQLINRETAKAIVSEGFQWINREEDLDIEGLRQSKSSYYPKELIRYNVLTYRRSL